MPDRPTPAAPSRAPKDLVKAAILGAFGLGTVGCLIAALHHGCVG